MRPGSRSNINIHKCYINHSDIGVLNAPAERYFLGPRFVWKLSVVRLWWPLERRAGTAAHHRTQVKAEKNLAQKLPQHLLGEKIESWQPRINQLMVYY